MEDEHFHLGSKKKHKKEKRKHKKHNSDKSEKEKSKKHKKHKKSKHKDSSEKVEKNGDYTPEKKKSPSPVIPNGKVSVEKLDSITAVNFIAEELDAEKKKSTTDIASSESDVQDVDCDSVDIDLDLIEADMDLEELMKQKELLQAQLAKAECEGIISPPEDTKDEKVTEVILLEDSDEPEATVPDTTKRKRSRSRERKILIRPREDAKRRRTHSRERSFKDHERDRPMRKYYAFQYLKKLVNI